jgi:hypothetical protein
MEAIRSVVGRVALTACFSLCAAVAYGAPVYRIIDVGVLPDRTSTRPFDMNDRGEVVGVSDGGLGTPLNFIWTQAHGIRPIDLSPRLYPYFPIRLNNRGEVVFFLNSPDLQEYYVAERDKKAIPFLAGTWAKEDVHFIAQINEAGQILGHSYIYAGNGIPWLWSMETGLSKPIEFFQKLTEFVPYRMNDLGQVVGTAFYKFGCSSRAVVYDDRTKEVRYLGPGARPGDPDPPCGLYGVATDINNAGQVVGWGNLRDDGDRILPFIWTAEDGMTVLPGGANIRKAELQPASINEAGQVVGTYREFITSVPYKYFYWDKETPVTHLRDLVDPNDPLRSQIVLLAGARPIINNRGEILVQGAYRPVLAAEPNRTFVLVPVRR